MEGDYIKVLTQQIVALYYFQHTKTILFVSNCLFLNKVTTTILINCLSKLLFPYYPHKIFPFFVSQLFQYSIIALGLIIMCISKTNTVEQYPIKLPK